MIDRLLSLLGRLPSTNARIATSIALFSLTVVVALAASVCQRPVDGATLYALLSAELLAMGLDVAQFTAKRRTHHPAPGGQP